MPKKTFQRHCREIEALFGISIVCDRHNGYRYYMDDNGELGSGSLSSWVLDSFAVSDMLVESRRLSGRILFERIPSGHRFLPAIISSMRFTRHKRRLPQPQSFPILSYMSVRPSTSVRNSSPTAETSRFSVRSHFGESFMTRRVE